METRPRHVPDTLGLSCIESLACQVEYLAVGSPAKLHVAESWLSGAVQKRAGDCCMLRLLPRPAPPSGLQWRGEGQKKLHRKRQ